MAKVTTPNEFNEFLKSQGFNSSSFQYMGKDCYDYKVKHIPTGTIVYIRY